MLPELPPPGAPGLVYTCRDAVLSPQNCGSGDRPSPRSDQGGEGQLSSPAWSPARGCDATSAPRTSTSHLSPAHAAPEVGTFIKRGVAIYKGSIKFSSATPRRPETDKQTAAHTWLSTRHRAGAAETGHADEEPERGVMDGAAEAAWRGGGL